MKESKLSKEITQLNFLLVIIYFVMIFGATLFIQNFYVDFKIKKLEEFYTENSDTLTVDKLLYYADNQGFSATVKPKSLIEKEAFNSLLDTNQKFSDYTQFLNMFNRLADKDLRMDGTKNIVADFNGNSQPIYFVSNDTLITLSLNESIADDIVLITMAIAIFTTLIFLIMITSVSLFINQRVGKPLDKLSTYIDDIASLSAKEQLTFTHEDEIAKIGYALMNMEHDLNREIVNRNELLRAITHELKTPLAHIVTLMYLHKSQVGEYAEFDFVNDEVQKIISENNELIQVTLSSLTETNKLKQQFDIKPFIENKIETFEVYLTDKEVKLDLDSYSFESNPVPLNLVFNNLLLNASKYSHSFLSVKNEANIITISNDFKDNAGTGVGKTIIKRLGDFENFDIKAYEQDGVYTTIVKLNKM